MKNVIETFSVEFTVRLRLCREADLPALEWFGLFTPHRGLIQDVFDRQERGEAIMLVAEANGEPSGQLWIDLQTNRSDGIAEIWAFRILPCLQRLGIGTRMMLAAEKMIRWRGFRSVQIAVEKRNPCAKRLYERLGYVVTGTRDATHPAPGPAGMHAAGATTNQWVLRKNLNLDHDGEDDDKSAGAQPHCHPLDRG